MFALERVTPEIAYLFLLFALFVLPRVLQRYRIPTAITSFAIGAAFGLGPGLFTHDPTVELLSTFGIVSLFLFAGLDVNVREMRRAGGTLAQHLVIRILMLAAVTVLLALLPDISTRVAALVALALLTPSTGFILDSLDDFGSSERERFWIRSKAIATELVALAVLFVTLQSTTPLRLGLSALVLAAMIGVLPLLFRLFAARVVPHAPKSEFAFLILVAVVCAFVTRELGVYYLVGAFVVGMAAQRFRVHLPSMASENMLHAVEAFASLFVPFYFFHAGLLLQREDFRWESLVAGAVFLVLMIPFRLAVVAFHRRLTLGEPMRNALRVSLAMQPTLVFTLVVAGLLREHFSAPSWVFGGLIVYTIVNTVLPGFALHMAPPDFESPHAPPAEQLAFAGAASPDAPRDSTPAPPGD